MDWADDLAYALADVEDFFRAGLIPLDRIAKDDDESVEFFERAAADLMEANFGYDAHEEGPKATKFLRRILKGAIESRYRGTREDRKCVHAFTNTFLDRYMNAVELVEHGPSYVSIGQAYKQEVMFLKQLTWQYVINDPALITLQRGQDRVIRQLFSWLEAWLEEAEKEKHRDRLPTRLREFYAGINDDPRAKEAMGNDIGQLRARAISDYIASLTERQALDLHGRLSGSTLSSILEGWVRI